MGRLDPGGAVRGEATGGDEEVDVGVVGQGTGPGVEDGEDGGAAADPLGIVGQGLDGGSGLPEEDTVDEALVGAGQGAELGRESERR